jgi:hypothetical protein
LTTTNPTWPDPGSNPGRRGGKPATNRLSYGAAHDGGKYISNIFTLTYPPYIFHVTWMNQKWLHFYGVCILENNKQSVYRRNVLTFILEEQVIRMWAGLGQGSVQWWVSWSLCWNLCFHKHTECLLSASWCQTVEKSEYQSVSLWLRHVGLGEWQDGVITE